MWGIIVQKPYLKMISFKKIGIILCIIAGFSNPSFAQEDKVMEDIAGDSYKFGFFTGQFTAACGFYQFGLISEDNAREFFDTNFKMINVIGISKENKKNLLAFGDQPGNSKCKRFMPND